ncbi:MAG: ribonuclease H-like domain-containing protein [Deltaproteobacteria bacterium]|nr:ribonuclease H-like domain-containing protein [Deltaproteobacteria bacterium]
MARTSNPDYLVLDIETVPDVDRWQRPDPGSGEPQFPPTWAQRIVVIGTLQLDAGFGFRRTALLGASAPPDASPDARERAILAELDAVMADRPILVTYNGRGFDLPVLALRSLCHAMPMAWYFRDRNVRYRYSDEGHLDLCDWLADHGAARAGRLDSLARLIGLPGKLGIDGSQVEPLWLEGKTSAVEDYCLSDVAQTAFLLLRYRMLQGHLAPDAYRERTSALVDALAADARLAPVIERIDRARLLPAP